jgi:hypothetical protein
MTSKPPKKAVASEQSSVSGLRDPNKLRADEVTPADAVMRVSMGNPTREAKTEGIEIRGCGAATKGRKARGPMA